MIKALHCMCFGWMNVIGQAMGDFIHIGETAKERKIRRDIEAIN